MTDVNPFIGLGVIVPPERVKGRDAELKELVSALRDGAQNVSIVGEPRIGKSSLANAAIRLLAPDPKLIRVRLTMSDYRTPAQFFRDILQQTVEQWEQEGTDRRERANQILGSPGQDNYEAYRDCKRGLKSLHRDGTRILLMVDEFDKISDVVESRETVLRFRELLYHYSDYGTSALIISRKTLEHIEERLVSVSNLRGVIAHVIYVRPLTRVGMVAIADRCRPAWSLAPAELDELWSMTGGHPFLAELVLYYSWSEASIDSGKKRSRLQLLQYYAEIKHQHEADGLFQALIQLTVGPRWSLTEDSVERILNFGVIRQDETGYTAFSDHYQLYLEKCAREGATIRIVGERLKFTIRDLIETVALRDFGPSWQDSATMQRPELIAHFASAKKLQDRDLHSFGNCSPRLLDYLYPMELWDVISSHWSVFAPLFAVPGYQGNSLRQYWRDRFVLFAKVRNPKMHHREHVVSSSEATLAGAYCLQIIEQAKNAQMRLQESASA